MRIRDIIADLVGCAMLFVLFWFGFLIGYAGGF